MKMKSRSQLGLRAGSYYIIDSVQAFCFQSVLRNGMNTSTRTLNNNYTHIYNMLYELKRHGKMGRIALNDSRKKSLEEFAETQERKQFTEIDAKDIQMVLDYLKRKKHSTRNIVVFLLVATMGMERSQLRDLKWEDIDKSYKHIWISGRKIDVCPVLQEYLAKLNKETKVRGKNPMFVFRVFYKNQYRKITESKINDIFDDLIHISDDDKWKCYSPKYVRNCLIGTLYRSGYKIEDIMYITGIDIANISKYIKVDELLEQRSKKTNWQNLYNGILCECK